MRWTGCVACTGENKNTYRVLEWESEEKDHLKELGVDGRIIWQWTTRNVVKKGPLERARSRWEDNMVMNHKKCM
jgi:hypothetical protein